MDWDKLRVFNAVAEAGSFTHTGERLNLSQSAVSRQLSALEDSLEVPLFHRHARGLKLTEQGEILHRTVREVLPEVRGPVVDIYFVYPEELRQSNRIAVLRDFLLRKIEEIGH